MSSAHQLEQLVEEAERLKERWGDALRRYDRDPAEYGFSMTVGISEIRSAVALATALSECREREEYVFGLVESALAWLASSEDYLPVKEASLRLREALAAQPLSEGGTP